MRKLLLSVYFLSFIILANAQVDGPNLGIMPAPVSIKITNGDFKLEANEKVFIVYESPADERIAYLFRDFLKQNYSLDLRVGKKRIHMQEKL